MVCVDCENNAWPVNSNKQMITIWRKKLPMYHKYKKLPVNIGSLSPARPAVLFCERCCYYLLKAKLLQIPCIFILVNFIFAN